MPCEPRQCWRLPIIRYGDVASNDSLGEKSQQALRCHESIPRLRLTRIAAQLMSTVATSSTTVMALE